MKSEELILEYYRKIKQANKEFTKKEIFKDLLNRLYSESKEILSEIDKISLGAEKTIFNIKLENRDKTGRADTFFNKVIIEFENNIKQTEEHAKEQLIEYLSGLYNSGEGYNFTLIVSDFTEWRIYAPKLNTIENLDKLSIKQIELQEIPNSKFVLTENNLTDFYYFIDKYLFKENKLKATLETIQQDFGEYSPTFVDVFNNLKKNFEDAKKYGEVLVAYDQWKRFLSLAYGSFDDNDDKYLIHTYLSVFSKILAYQVLTGDDFIDDNELLGIIKGDVFNSLNIKNFIEHDFYFWVSNDTIFKELKKSFRKIAQQISLYDFSTIDEDILKGVYQELIDLDTRHSLGEYYTPDWLCESVINSFTFKQTDKILDPACGSGSFLRATIAKQKELFPNEEINELNDRVYGIDIHPLSVQIAKTTVLLSLGNKIKTLRKPLSINVYLANTLLAPSDSISLFGNEFKLTIDKKTYILKSSILSNNLLFDEALNVCEELAETSSHKKKETVTTLKNTLIRKAGISEISNDIIDSFYSIYEGFKEAKEKERNGIWKFIVHNSYKPYFLKDTFDYIIGNPPWLTFKDIKNKEYADLLKTLATDYNVMPQKIANFPQMEIAAIFLVHACNYFLNEKGKIAFVLPRSFMSSDSHDKTRKGEAKGLKIKEVWDLDKVQPLFRVPSCVLFAEKSKNGNKQDINGFEGKIFEGKFKKHNSKFIEIQNNISFNNVKHYYSTLGTSSAFTSFKINSNNEVCYYKTKFKNGATIVPRGFYFVDIDMQGFIPEDFKNRTLNIKTSKATDAKKPWDTINFKGLIESDFLFRTALAKNILPFVLYKPELVLLPLKIDEQMNIQLVHWEELKNEGYLSCANWFRNTENMWNTLRTEKNENFSYLQYLNWQNKLTSQKLQFKYIVIYNASAKDANTAIVEFDKLDLPFFAECASYLYYTNDFDEAGYLLACLNSDFANKMIKPFQAKGLFGARHVSKKILDVPFPKFDKKDTKHQQLSNLGKLCYDKAQKFIDTKNSENYSGLNLGKIRLDIKKHLQAEINQIDTLLTEMITIK